MQSRWIRLIAEQGESGETVGAFCRDRGLTTSQFYTWRKRLGGSVAERFLEVQVAKAARQAPLQRGAIAVRLGEGCCVLVEPGFDADHLRAVVAALETRG
ncbi:MAG: transposase [Bryobacterales bacterium]|nr:transposase [Bryobacterales bacterium]